MISYIYIIATVSTFGLLHSLSANSALQTRFSRTVAGGAAGVSSYGWLSTYTSSEALISSCVAGTFGGFGYFMVAGLFSLLGVWGWNLFTTRKFLVV